MTPRRDLPGPHTCASCAKWRKRWAQVPRPGRATRPAWGWCAVREIVSQEYFTCGAYTRRATEGTA